MSALEAMWSRYPWTRCAARLTLADARRAGSKHWGRCDLRKFHETDHALERGFDVVWFRVQLVRR